MNNPGHGKPLHAMVLGVLLLLATSRLAAVAQTPAPAAPAPPAATPPAAPSPAPPAATPPTAPATPSPAATPPTAPATPSPAANPPTAPATPPPAAAPPPAAPAVPPAAPAPQLSAPKTLADLQAVEAQVKQVVARALPAVVGIRVGTSQGSGVIVSEDGYIMTAGHVIARPNQPAVIIFADGKTAKGTTLGLFRSADAGLAKITDPGKWPFVEKGKSAELAPGAWCVALGHPLGYQEGRPPVTRVGRLLLDQGPMLQTDCTLVAGDSGGPLFDLEGKVIGIHSRIAGSLTMNFHVPVDIFHQAWERMAKGESWDENLPGKDSDQVKGIVQPLMTPAAACAVRVLCDGDEAALGTIVGPDGWILTKASQLEGRVVCRLRDGRFLEAKTVGVSRPLDLAMLKIEARGLPSIAWSTATPSVGQWVAAPGDSGDRPLALGVISLAPRKIAPAGGVLGVALADAEQGARITQVLPGTSAEKAGLKVDDVVLEIDGKAVQNQMELVGAVRQHRLGDVVRLKVRRGAETSEISATLARPDTPGMRKRDQQNRSDLGISQRADDFPLVLQHDLVLRPVDCGGPLVDLNGGVIGVNIARAGRTETYTLPASAVLGQMYDLMSGRLSPDAPPAPGPSQPPKYFQDQREGEPGEAK